MAIVTLKRLSFSNISFQPFQLLSLTERGISICLLIMKNSLITVFIFFINLQFVSCVPEPEIAPLPLANESKEIAFSLDSVSPFTSYSLEYDIKHKSLSLYNDLTQTIDFYSFKTLNKYKSIPISKKGPHGIGEGGVDHISHHIIDSNKIVIYNDLQDFLFIMDSLGHLKDRVLIKRPVYTGKLVYSFPSPWPSRRMIYNQNNIYMAGGIIDNRVPDETLVTNVIKVDLAGHQATWHLTRPDMYNKGNWGTNGSLYALSSAYNENKKEFYYGFAAEDSICVIDRNWTQIKKVLAKSKTINNIEPPARRNSTLNSNESVKYDYTTKQYQKLIYDPFRKFIYRMTYQGLDKSEFETGGDELVNGREETIIVMDAHFKVLGEYRLPKRKYFTAMYLVTDDGLLFAKKSSYIKNDKKLTFGVISFK
jgi:hypothetical protein